MNKKQRWLTRIKNFHNEVESQQQDDISPPLISKTHYWRDRLMGALFGVGATLLILGVNNVNTENYVLKTKVNELEQHLKKVTQRSVGFDLYEIMPNPLSEAVTTTYGNGEPTSVEYQRKTI